MRVRVRGEIGVGWEKIHRANDLHVPKEGEMWLWMKDPATHALTTNCVCRRAWWLKKRRNTVRMSPTPKDQPFSSKSLVAGDDMACYIARTLTMAHFENNQKRRYEDPPTVVTSSGGSLVQGAAGSRPRMNTCPYFVKNTGNFCLAALLASPVYNSHCCRGLYLTAALSNATIARIALAARVKVWTQASNLVL